MKKILFFFCLIFFSVNANAGIFIDNFTDTDNTDLNVHNPDWNAYSESPLMFWYAKIFSNQAWLRADQNGANNFIKVNLEDNDANLSGQLGVNYSVKFHLIDLNYISGGTSQIQNTIIRPSDGNFLVNLRFLRSSVSGDVNAVTQYNGVDLNNTVVLPGDYFEIKLTKKNTFVYDINFFRNGNNLAFAADTNLNSDTFNFQFGLDSAGGMTYKVDDFNVTKTDVNLSSNVVFSNYQTYLTNNYVKDLNFSINYNCITGLNANVMRAINDVNDTNYSLTCDDTSRSTTGVYTHSLEGRYNIKFYSIDFNSNTTTKISDANFISDLNAPTIDINFGTISAGFSASVSQVPVKLTCNDIISPKVNYTIKNFNDVNLLYAQYDANTTQSVNADVNIGENIFNGICNDLVGNTSTDQNTVTVYSACFRLVNEQTGTILSTTDINTYFTNLTATSYETNQQLNFKSPLANSTCYSQISDDTIRFDLNYATGLFLYKEFDLDIVKDINSTLNICVAQPQDFFEQLFISAQQRPLIVQNLLTECYSLADYTKYVYQDGLSHRAFTISMPYSLTTFVDGNEVTLNIVNGGVESQTQLDVLIFKAQEILLGLQPDELSISPYYSSTTQTDTNIIQVSYQNLDEDATLVNIKIYDDNGILFNQNFTSSPNDFVTYFDFTGVTTTTEVFRLVLTKTLTTGVQETTNKYFTLRGGSSLFPAGLAAIIAIIFFLFFFTIVGWESSLGIFGVIVNAVALGILALSPSAGWIIILQSFFLIGIIYLGLISLNKTQAGY